MIKGIGTDLIDLNRIKQQIVRNDRLADRVLTSSERLVYDTHTNLQRKTEYLGGRFAAKEAFAKAAGQGIGKAFNFKDIQVLNDKQGAPNLDVQKLSNTAGLFVSIAHTDSHATAFVIIEES